MSSWTIVLGEALAVLGLAIGLSALSYAHYDARERGMPFRDALDILPCRAGCHLAMLLVGLGLGLSSRSLCERVGWVAFALIYVALVLRTWHHRQAASTTDAVPDKADKLGG